MLRRWLQPVSQAILAGVALAALFHPFGAPWCPAAEPPAPMEELPTPRKVEERADGGAARKEDRSATALPLPLELDRTPAVGITLVDALRIASLANFDIAQAQQLV